MKTLVLLVGFLLGFTVAVFLLGEGSGEYSDEINGFADFISEQVQGLSAWVSSLF